MANEEQVALLKKGRKVWNEWRKENPNIEIDLSGANFVNANFAFTNLSGANLAYANLASTNLGGTKLNKANLFKANLSFATFSYTKLSYANLSFASFNFAHFLKTNLYKANLSSAIFISAKVRCTVFNFANLDNADLRRSTFSDEASLVSTNLSKADLQDASLISIDLSSANLYKANLVSVKLIGSKLIHTNLRSANLSNADLSCTDLCAANLRDANLRNATFCKAHLRSANLRYAKLHNADLSGANLIGTQALHAEFENATLTGACISDWQIGLSTNFENAKCDYIFRTHDDSGKAFNTYDESFEGLDVQFTERLPLDPIKKFAPGEFEQWMKVRKRALDTIDITFSNGINWQAFFQSLQIARQQYPDADVVMRSVEEEDGIFVARLKVETGTTGEALDKLKAEIETQLKAIYERQLADAQVEIQVLERSLDKVLEKLAMTNKYTFNAPVNNVADINHGTMIGYINQNGEAISQLITALRSTAQTFPTEQKEEVLMELDDLEGDLNNPQKQEPKRIRKRFQRIIAAGATAATIAGGAATFSGNVNEFTENVLKLGENVGLTRELIMGDQTNP